MGKWRNNFPTPESISEWEDAWGGEIASVGLSYDEIAQGLTVCGRMDFVPILSDFMKACRPTLDPEIAHAWAVENMRKRRTPAWREGKPVFDDQWPDAAVYWAAVEFGEDLQAYPYSAIRKRWTAALDRARRENKPAPPPATLALAPPAPDISEETRQENLRKLREIRDMLEGKTNAGVQQKTAE